MAKKIKLKKATDTAINEHVITCTRAVFDENGVSLERLLTDIYSRPGMIARPTNQ